MYTIRDVTPERQVPGAGQSEKTLHRRCSRFSCGHVQIHCWAVFHLSGAPQWCPCLPWRLRSFERWPYISAQPLDRGRISPLPPGLRQSGGAGRSQLRLGRFIRFLGLFYRKRYRTCIARARKYPRDLNDSGGILVSDTGIEPATSSVSGKRATAAPIAQACIDQTVNLRGGDGI